ncbi:MAG: C4-dicarboxylate ABC transporter [Desulfobacteraceae bacterium]|nr:MAG: C4-dicarboxylate ABC transporter [Desulfobacteraceae bacterium]
MEKNRPNIADSISSAVAGLPPAYFALVMATGIVSIASHLFGYAFIAIPLFWMNVVFYLLLWAMTLARVLLHTGRFFDDLSNHSVGVGFFTVVAGSCVLGNQFVLILHSFGIAGILLGIGFFLWAFLIYFIFTLFTVKSVKPPLETGINGVWLVSIVATQSVSILAGLVVPGFSAYGDLLLFFSFCMFLIGGMLYLLVIMLIFYRFMFFTLKPEALGPPYWINMGAVAISTLAGATLILNSQRFALLETLSSFILGVTLFFWSAATWWIPFLLLLGAWRYLVRRVKFVYEPQYWGMVFPLGMYTVCTFRLAQVVDLNLLVEIPRYFIFAALAAWGFTFAGLLRHILGPVFGTRGAGDRESNRKDAGG